MSEKLQIFDPPSTPTRVFGPLIAEASKNGKTVYRADVGMPQEPYPLQAKEALIKVVQEMKIAGYGPEIDPNLTQALVSFYQKRFSLPLDEETISKSLIAGLGASEFFSLVLPLITDNGDKIFAFDPHYGNFNIPMALFGREWIVGKTDENFHPQIADLEKSLGEDKEKRIKILYLNSPNNPTGAVYTKEEIKKLIDLAIQHQLWIIWDGVYWNYNYTDNPNSILELIKDYDRETQAQILNQLIVLDSVSKTFFLCDWRLGWAMIFNPNLRQAISNAASYRGNISIATQKAAADLVTQTMADLSILENNKNLYRQKRDLVYRHLQFIVNQGLIRLNQPPEGGIYVTFQLTKGTAEEFLRFVLTEYQENDICTFVPLTTESGSFYLNPEDGRQAIRLCFGMPKNQIENALRAFVDQLNAYYHRLNNS